MSNFCSAKVEIQPDCAGAWTDVSGNGAAVSWDGGEVKYGVQHTFDGDVPKLASGKPGEVTITFRACYSEAAGEVTELVRTIYEAGCDRDLCFRWTPLGATVGNKQYTTVSGFLITPTWPQGDAENADTTMIEFKVVAATVTVADVA